MQTLFAKYRIVFLSCSTVVFINIYTNVYVDIYFCCLLLLSLLDCFCCFNFQKIPLSGMVLVENWKFLSSSSQFKHLMPYRREDWLIFGHNTCIQTHKRTYTYVHTIRMSATIDTEKFIEDIFSEPIIWNRNCGSNKSLTESTWEGLSKKFGASSKTNK